ncbi:methyl-accepting chemotaxis protein [Halobacillus litoralis]|uniref:methyl-accepting chemotaxis protein n=1 Tax=Halobacillus litoralis TaxID=45668 RepID=UPI001CFC7619|nr:methyl-accepting chemotaxis protein [Halobacillus litoralis]
MFKKKQRNQKGSFFKRTLQRQILIPFLTLIVAAGFIIGYASYSFSVKITTDELTDNIKEQTSTLSHSFDIFFRTQEDIVNYYVTQPNLLDVSSDTDNLVDTLDDLRSSSSTITNAYIGIEETGETITDSSLSIPDGFDPRDRPWYKQAVDQGEKAIWTEPYIDENTGETIMSVAKAVFDGEDLIGVFSIDLNMESLLQLIEGVQIADSGYAAIFSKSGTFLSHPTPELIGTDVSDESYYKKILEQNQTKGVINYQFEGNDKILAYAVNDKTDWIIVGTVNKSELEQKGAAILLPIATTVLIILVLSIIVSFIIAKRIRRPITTLQKKMKSVEEGDLTVNLLQNREDEIGQLSNSANEMKESIKQMIQQLQTVTESVTNQSTGLKQAAEEVREGSEQIASTMEELSAGSESQAHSSSRISEMMETFAKEIQQAHLNGKDVSNTSSDVLAMTGDGSEMMRHSVKQMQNIDSIVKESVEKVQGLDQQSKEISKLVQVIQDIAEQTNLLSLNAAIEAARAGEHGKGFAVVADEVRKLAEQVTNSVGDITTIVSGIQTESSMVVDTLQNGYHEVDQGTKQMETTGETFTRIEQAVTQMVTKSRDIADKLDKISNDSYEINASIEEVASVSQESAAGVEQVTAAAQQSNSSVEEVSLSADELSSLSEKLNEQMKQFKV